MKRNEEAIMAISENGAQDSRNYRSASLRVS